MLTSLKILAVAIAMPVFFALLPCNITSSILTYLFSYSSLENLHTINGTLNIQFDTMLVNINGLNNLTNLEGLNNIDTIRSSLEVGDNKLSNFEGINNLKSISGSLRISGCNYLENLEGLDNLSQINRNLEIVGNPLLHDLTSLNSIIEIGDRLTLHSNNMLKNLTGLENITHIDSKLEIILNDSLENLSGLDNLSFIGDELRIEGNISLTSLSGLENLTAMRWLSACVIGCNPVLVDIHGIENIDFKSTFLISFYENTLLSECDVLSICEAIENPNVLTLFNNNNEGCNTEIEIENACDFSAIEEYKQNIFFSPNPASNQITISNYYVNNINEINIYNLNGQIIYRQIYPECIMNLTEFAKGIYLIEFDLKEDIEFVFQKIENIHVNPYFKYSKEFIDSCKNEMILSLVPMDTTEFNFWILPKVNWLFDSITQIQNTHISDLIKKEKSEELFSRNFEYFKQKYNITDSLELISLYNTLRILAHILFVA